MAENVFAALSAANKDSSLQINMDAILDLPQAARHLRLNLRDLYFLPFDHVRPQTPDPEADSNNISDSAASGSASRGQGFLAGQAPNRIQPATHKCWKS